MSRAETTSRAARIKDAFKAVRGTWSESWENILALDPDFLEAYLKLSSIPERSGALDEKSRHFIYIAVDAAATHLYIPGIRQHIQAAYKAGATEQELMEVLELTSTLGIHSANVGVPILWELLEEEQSTVVQNALDDRRLDLKRRFERIRGYWHPFWEGLLLLDPDFFEAYLAFSSVPWEHGSLEPKIKELIYCAFDASATHLFKPGLKLHMRNALRYGATIDELMCVLEITSTIGIHAATTAAPLILDSSLHSS